MTSKNLFRSSIQEARTLTYGTSQLNNMAATCTQFYQKKFFFSKPILKLLFKPCTREGGGGGINYFFKSLSN